MATRLKGLGRGLDALLGGGDQAQAAPASARPDTEGKLPVGQLQRGRYQPRTRMDEAALNELAASIRLHGLMQPILVRKLEPGSAAPEGGVSTPYEIIAGERRWRAAQIAGLTEVPVLIREVPDSQALAMALIENIQREDLNPLEEANGIQRLINEFNLTHELAAEAVGRSRAATSNLLRLLTLAGGVQAMLLADQLEMGHARALLALESGAAQFVMAQRIRAENLSVREAEKIIQNMVAPVVAARPAKVRQSRDIERYAEELSQRFGTTVEIRPGKKGAGKLVLSYSSNEDLENLVSKFKG